MGNAHICDWAGQGEEDFRKDQDIGVFEETISVPPSPCNSLKTERLDVTTFNNPERIGDDRQYNISPTKGRYNAAIPDAVFWVSEENVPPVSEENVPPVSEENEDKHEKEYSDSGSEDDENYSNKNRAIRDHDNKTEARRRHSHPVDSGSDGEAPSQSKYNYFHYLLPLQDGMPSKSRFKPWTHGSTFQLIRACSQIFLIYRLMEKILIESNPLTYDHKL